MTNRGAGRTSDDVLPPDRPDEPFDGRRRHPPDSPPNRHWRVDVDEGLTDPRAVSALRSVAHPVRLRILSLVTAEAMSAADVARALDLTHANALYHLRVLHDAGDRKSTRLNSSHTDISRMPSSA